MLNTVNVIEKIDDSITQLVAFNDDVEGNKKAEELFCKIADENDFAVVNDDLDNGYLEKNNWQLFLVHSTS